MDEHVDRSDALWTDAHSDLDSMDTVRPAPARSPEPWDDDEEIVVVPRSRLPALIFGALGIGLLAGAIGLVAVTIPEAEPGPARIIEAIRSADGAGEALAEASPPEVPREVAPILPSPPSEIGGEGEIRPRRWRRSAQRASRPPPMPVGALPAMSVSALPRAE